MEDIIFERQILCFRSKAFNLYMNSWVKLKCWSCLWWTSSWWQHHMSVYWVCIVNSLLSFCHLISHHIISYHIIWAWEPWTWWNAYKKSIDVMWNELVNSFNIKQGKNTEKILINDHHHHHHFILVMFIVRVSSSFIINSFNSM